VNEINWSAAQLARQCARGKNVFVAGSVGPLGISADEAKARGIDRQSVFQEQLGALLDGGVHLIFFETFTEFDELALALHVKQSLHHCPEVCSMACQPGSRLPRGLPIDEAFQKLRALDAEIVGVNCVEPHDSVELFQKISVDGAMSAFPNAGNKTRATPEEFTQIARDLAHAGVKLIGGCCGTTPAHIAAMTIALAEPR
jgi:homocysteine S-methyltransferase